MAKLVFGCGYLGRRVAQRWTDQGEPVYAVTRSAQHAQEFESHGLHPLIADVTEPASLQHLPAAKTVLYAVGYDRSAGKPIGEVYVNGLQHVLSALPPSVERFIYISSTGVYGQSSGEWVDEDSPCRPDREGGRACLAAENVLQTHSLGACAIILRLGGIYGPRRIPRRQDLQQGVPIAAAEQGYLNLIHVDDAAEIVVQVATSAEPPALYTVTDGRPVVRGDYFRELARLTGSPPPRFIAPDRDSPRGQRASSDKRISNRRLLADFDVRLRYPTYREGLAAILSQE